MMVSDTDAACVATAFAISVCECEGGRGEVKNIVNMRHVF
jgi:hypothetical protein